MNAKELPPRPSLPQYRKQAKDLVKGFSAAQPEAIQRIRQFHPRLGPLPESEIPHARFGLADAQWVIAREHGFESWAKFVKRIEARNLVRENSPYAIWKMMEKAVIEGDISTAEHLVAENKALFREQQPPEYGPGGLRPDYSSGDARKILLREHQFEGWQQVTEARTAREQEFTTWQEFAEFRKQTADGDSAIGQFEAAAQAVVWGDAATLRRLLRARPELARERSARRHHATLLHYVSGINGGESFRQRCPENAVEMAEILLDAGAEVDATASLYVSETALELVATGIHPLLAGVQDALMEALLDRGADVNGASGRPIINACLANGRQGAAELLARRGARLDLEAAAGVGRLDLVREFFNRDGTLKPNATEAQRKDAFTWACEFGRTSVAAFLLDRGQKIDAPLRHHGQTGLHWAAGGGHAETVRMLLERKAPVDAKDETWQKTPLSWALFGWHNPTPGVAKEGYYAVAALLVAAGAKVEPEWRMDESVQADPAMVAALAAKQGG